MAEQSVDRRAFASAYDPKVVADYIAQAAQAQGIDPDVALRVAKSEGLYSYTGDQGSSFGPFQLHYGNVAGGGNKVGGLGDVFTRTTGLDARDPRTWQAQVDFALGEAARGGWGPWHGWKGEARAGLPGGPQGGQLYETGRFIPQEQPAVAGGAIRDAGPVLPLGAMSPESMAYAPTISGPQQLPPIQYSAPPNQYASASTMNDATRAPVQLTHENFLDDHFLTPQPTQTQAAQGQPAALTHDNFLEGVGGHVEPPKVKQEQGVVAAQGPQEWGMGRSFARGASWGLAEPLEVAASIAKHGTHGLPLGEAFSKGMENIAKSREAYRLAEPGVSMIAEGLGSAVGVPGMTAARAVGALGKAAAAGARAIPELAPAVPAVSKFMSGAGGVASRATRGAVEGAALATAEQAPWMTRPEDRGIGNVLAGAAGGAVGSALLAPITKAITLPFEAKVSPQLANIATNLNNKFGLNIRPSQLTNNPELKKIDQAFVSPAVKNQQYADWHKAVAQDLNTTAQNLNRPGVGISEITKPAIESAKRETGQALDDTVAGSYLVPDRNFINALGAIQKKVDNTDIGNPIREAYKNAVLRLNANLGPNGIRGEAFRDMIKQDGGYISNQFLNSDKPLYQSVGRDLRKLLMDSFEITNPAKRGEYNALSEHYRKLMALGNVVKDDLSGQINPKALLSQVSKRNLTGDFRDLARVGQRLEKEPITATSNVYRTVREFGMPHLAEVIATGLGFPAAGMANVVNVLQAGQHALQVPQRLALQSPALARQVFTGNQAVPSFARGAEQFAARLGANALTGYGAPERVR